MMENERAGDANPDLAAALRNIALDLPAQVVERLDAYRCLLWEKNRAVNLTRHTTLDLFARRDVYDAWQLSQLLEEGEEVLDLGTGGGVPGIPLAILRPDVRVSLSDSVQKKARAADAFVQQLELPVTVYAMPAQEDLRFSSVVTRAVGTLARQLNWLRDCWDGFDRLLAIKGPKWVEERGEARHRGLLRGLQLRKLSVYEMPGTGSHSFILQVTRPGSRFAVRGTGE